MLGEISLGCNGRGAQGIPRKPRPRENLFGKLTSISGHHLAEPKASRLRWITTDMIDMADYGGGVNYSLIEQNIAIAEWIRSTYRQLEAELRA